MEIKVLCIQQLMHHMIYIIIHIIHAFHHQLMQMMMYIYKQLMVHCLSSSTCYIYCYGDNSCYYTRIYYYGLSSSINIYPSGCESQSGGTYDDTYCPYLYSASSSSESSSLTVDELKLKNKLEKTKTAKYLQFEKEYNLELEKERKEREIHFKNRDNRLKQFNEINTKRR